MTIGATSGSARRVYFSSDGSRVAVLDAGENLRAVPVDLLAFAAAVPPRALGPDALDLFEIGDEAAGAEARRRWELARAERDLGRSSARWRRALTAAACAPDWCARSAASSRSRRRARTERRRSERSPRSPRRGRGETPSPPSSRRRSQSRAAPRRRPSTRRPRSRRRRDRPENRREPWALARRPAVRSSAAAGLAIR
jgi:hypothetical protein